MVENFIFRTARLQAGPWQRPGVGAARARYFLSRSFATIAGTEFT